MNDCSYVQYIHGCGFVNPIYTPVVDANGIITDVKVTYTEGYMEQMLRYSSRYAGLRD